MMIPVLDRFAPLAAAYDALLCDAWGVIHNGVDLFDGAAEAMRRFRAERGPVVILTNAPRPSAVIPPQLDRLGLPRDAYDAIVTSGDATRAAIAARIPAPAFRLGPAKDEALYDDLDVAFAPIEEAGFIICTGLFDDVGDALEDYDALLDDAGARGLTMICANPDIVVNYGGRLIYCAGALAERYAARGGDVVYAGKPHPPIYDLAFDKLKEARGEVSRVLAVGDGLQTDILGANHARIDAAYIFGAGGVGEPGAADDLENAISAALDGAGVRAVAALERLVW
ncbi:MAG: TIGR01459 family HAD-type hydrolase [Pseudomonadota bacterium]